MTNDFRLVVPVSIIEEMKDIVFQTPVGYETGVALFGTLVKAPHHPIHYFVVLAVAGPGPGARHERACYSSDTNYTSAIYRALKSALPSISWLGELHLHPAGMIWLSNGDRRMVRRLLTGTAGGTVHPQEFIAGVMQRKASVLGIHPVFFDREHLDGIKLSVEQVACTDSLVRKARSLAASDPIQESEAPSRFSIWRKPFTIFHRRKKP